MHNSYQNQINPPVFMQLPLRLKIVKHWLIPQQKKELSPT